MFNIEFINTAAKDVDYSAAAISEYKAGLGNGIEKYTAQFEQDFALKLDHIKINDIGGLNVYTNKEDGDVVAVYDYENFCGWLAK